MASLSSNSCKFPVVIFRTYIGFTAFPKVIRYDEGRYAVLRDINDLATYIDQNSSPDIQRRRFVRMALRALEGRIVNWPYDHLEVSLLVL